MVDRELHGIGFAVMLCHLAGLASEKLDDCVVTEVLFPRLLQIQYARERDHTLERGFVGGEAEGELSAGGVAHHRDFGRVEVVSFCNLRDVTISVANVFEGAGPASAAIADAAVLDVPGGNSFRGQRGAEVSAVGQVVLDAPVASVNGHRHRERALGFRKANICKLIGIGAVGESGIGRGWREVENIFRGHWFGRLSSFTSYQLPVPGSWLLALRTIVIVMSPVRD